MICTVEDAGVASPMWNSDTGLCLLIKKETGIRTRNDPIMPCTMTNLVFPMPLKNPIKQKKTGVSRQSIA